MKRMSHPAHKRFLPLVALGALPLLWFSQAGGRVLGARTMDLVGHLSNILFATKGQLTRTTMVAHPLGADLMAINGGWADILLAWPLAELFGLSTAYNAVFALYVLLAGVGAWVLARCLGASPWAAAVAGLLLQLDGFMLRNLTDGRVEQGALGMVALALAGALRCWRAPGWLPVLATGLAGAAVVYMSWELALFLGLAVLLLAPALLWRERCWAAASRWGAALAIAAALAGPWALVFLQRASQTRDLYEGLQTLEDARLASVGLLAWFAELGASHPAYLGLAALLLLPWSCRRRDRPLWLAAGLGLVLTLALALGPDPGLHRPGDLLSGKDAWGPYAWVQSLPIVGWFHTPDRLLCAWSLACPVAAALLLDWLASKRRGPWIATALGGLMVATAVLEARAGARWPRGDFAIPHSPALRQLAAIPGEGALLDLPPHRHRLRVLPYQALQLAHQRPIPYHMASPLLTTDVIGPMLSSEPFFAWFARAGSGTQGRLDPDALAGLRRHGLRFVALHVNLVPPKQRGSIRRAMERALGEPILRDGQHWSCWELPAD